MTADSVPIFGNVITDPWTYGFMQRGVLVAMMVSVVGAVVGTFVVLKGLAFVGDAMAHSTLPGVAVAFTFKANVLAGAAVAAVLAALGIAFVSRRGRVAFDTAIGIVFAASFALGVLILSRQRNYTADLFNFILGDILGISAGDVWVILAMTVAVLALVFLFYKELVITSWDPLTAETTGVPATAIQYGLILALGLTTVVAIQAVGIVLVVAFLVTPAATGSLLARSLRGIMLVGSVVGVLSAIGGMYISYYASVASGATIVLVATGFFILALLLSPRRGLLRRRWRSEAREE